MSVFRNHPCSFRLSQMWLQRGDEVERLKLFCRVYSNSFRIRRSPCQYMLFDQHGATGAPKDQIFPNTSEASKMDFCVLKKPVWEI